MSEKALFFALTIFQLFIGNIKVKAQEQNLGHWQIGANYSRSFIIKHAPDIGHLITGSPEGFNLFFEQTPNGSKAWHQAYRFAPVGVAVGYFDLKNDDLGDLIHTSVYLNLPIVSSEFSKLHFMIGSGLGFATEPYHRELNNKNLIFGSRLSFMLTGNLNWNIMLPEGWGLRSGLMINHFSNGAIKLPNKGINMVGFELGVSKGFQGSSTSQEQEVKESKPWEFIVQLSGGASQPYVFPEKRYPFYHLGLYTSKRLGTFNRLVFGVDGFYNLGVEEEIRAHFILRNQPSLPDFKRFGIVLGHELWMDRLALSIMIGRYLYEPFPAFTSFYQRYGLKYRLGNKVHISASLKSHAGRAEGIEWGVGYTF